MLGSLGNRASLLLIPDSSSESGDQTRQSHLRVRWNGLQSTHPQESTQEMGCSEQPQGERGAPISQIRKLRLSGKEGTTCPLQSSAQLRDKLQESSSGVPPPSAHEGLEPPPLLHPLHRRGDERKHTLSPSLPPSDSSCAGFAKGCHSPRGLLSPFPASTTTHQLPPPPPSAGLGNKSSRSCPARGPQAWPGSERLPPQPDLRRSRPGSRTGARRPHWPPTRAWEGGFGPGRPPPPLLF